MPLRPLWHWSKGMQRTIIRRCLWWRPALRVRGSPISTACATWTGNLGHRNPASTATAHAQVDTVTLLNRALHADRLGPLGAALAQLCGKDVVLPMNSDAEAVESGLRVARKWGADVNGLPAGRHDIILANNNFHGHTSSVVSFSSDPAAGSGVEPSTPGLRSVPFGDAAAPAQTIDDNTVADLLEPIPGQAGIIVPADDYLPAASSTTC